MSIFSELFRKKEEENPSFLFDAPRNTACFTCRQVVKEGKPILYVSHDEDDGAWQFLTGEENLTSEDMMMVSLLQIIEIDPGVNALHEMPEGYFAERATPTSEWKAYKRNWL